MHRETKALGALTADLKAVVNDDGTYDITLSVPTEDRDGEIIDAKAFEPLPDWLNIDIDHGMSVLTTVGSGAPAYDGDVLKLRGFTFASTSLGQDVKTLVDEGHIRKMSVAFMAATREIDQKDKKPHIRKAELLNAAVVAIPSNRQADIVVGAKSLAVQHLENALAAVALAQAEVAHIEAMEGDDKTLSDIVPDDAKTPDTAPEQKAAAPAAASALAVSARAKATAALAEADVLLTD